MLGKGEDIPAQMEQLGELIEEKISYAYINLAKNAPIPYYFHHEISNIVPKEFDILLDVQLHKQWQINSFEEIGWYEPFPNETRPEFKIPTCEGDLNFKLSLFESPKLRFMPTK